MKHRKLIKYYKEKPEQNKSNAEKSIESIIVEFVCDFLMKNNSKCIAQNSQRNNNESCERVWFHISIRGPENKLRFCDKNNEKKAKDQK